MSKTNGISDFEKVFITVALWFASSSSLIALLTLSMLPAQVTTFMTSAPGGVPQYYSKYNNLLILLESFVPTVIILVVASLKKRGKITHNFPSIMLAVITLSLCFGGVTLYGISEQFAASKNAQPRADTLVIISVVVSVILSVLSSMLPGILNSARSKARLEKRSLYMKCVHKSLCAFWTVGAYGFVVAGVGSSVLRGVYSIIPPVVYLIFITVFTFVCAHRYKTASETNAPEA